MMETPLAVLETEQRHGRDLFEMPFERYLGGEETLYRKAQRPLPLDPLLDTLTTGANRLPSCHPLRCLSRSFRTMI